MKKLILILFLITSQIWATDYYFSSSEGDDLAGAGTQTNPYATLDKLATLTLVAGDNVYFKRGDTWAPATLSGRVALILLQNVHGSAGNYITFGAYGTGSKPVISKKNTTDYGSGVRFKTNVSYIRLENIAFEDCGISFWMLKLDDPSSGGVHHIQIVDFEMSGGNITTYNPMIGSPVSVSNVPNSNDPYTLPLYKIEIGNGIMQDCSGEDAMNFIYGVRYIDSNGVALNGTGELKTSSAYLNRGQINWTTESMPDTNFWIHDMTILNIGLNGEAIDLPGGNLHLIERNVMSGSRSSGNVFKVHSEYSTFTDCIIRDNEISGAYYDVSWIEPDPGYPNSSSSGMVLKQIMNCIIENNTTSARYPFNFGDQGARSGTDVMYGTFKNNIIRNNNIYGTAQLVGTGGVSSWGYLHFLLDSVAIVNTFEGNNFWHSPDAQWLENGGKLLFKCYPADGSDSYHISTDASTVGAYRGNFTDIWVTQMGANDTSVDPEMVNAWFTSPYDRGDYSLDTGSPLIDAGEATGNSHSQDILGEIRTQGIIDVGAYETSAGDIPGQLTFSPESITMGTVSTSETQSSTLTISNIGTSDSVIVSAVTFTGAYDSLFTVADIYVVVGGISATVVPPYEMEAGTSLYVDLEFDGSTVTGAKTGNISVDHNSSVMANDPWLIPVSVTVSDASVVFSISGDTAKVFTTALGAEELTNWDLTNWSATDPDGWTIQGEDVLPSTANSVNETTSGSGVARLQSDGTYVSMKQYSVTTSGGRYLFEIDIDAVTLGSLKLTNGSQIKSWNTPQVDKFYFVADGSHAAIERGSSSTSHQVDINYVSIKQITSSWNATATITATGSLTCDDIQLSNGTNFSITSATSFSLTDGQTFDLTYSFTPSDTGYFKDTIVISGLNASNKTVDSLFIEGYFESGYSPTATKNLKTIGLTGSTFSIAATDTGSTTVDSVQFYNDGDGDLTLDSLVWSGGDESDFTLYSLTTNDTTLSATDTTDLGIGFSPTSSGVKTAYLSVYHNGDNIASPLVITVTAQATIAQTDPYIVMINPPSGNLSVGTIEVNSTSNVSLIWTNTGTTTFTYSAGIDGVSGFVSYLSGGLVDSTQQDEIDTLRFAVTPTSAGAFTDTIRFSSHNASNWTSTQEFVISGTAVNTSANFAIDYSYYYFGVQDTSNQDTLTVTITNDRADALSGVIKLVDASGDDYTGEQYTLLNSSGTAVDSISYSTYTTSQFNVTSQPTDELPYYVRAKVTHNASNVVSPQYVEFWNMGNVVSKLAVIPTNYHFGSAYLGSSLTSNDLIAYNKGRDTITVDSIYLATNSVFTIADTLSATLPGNLVFNGGFDKDTLWTFSGCEIDNNKLAFTTGTANGASQTLSGLRQNSTYLVVMDISNHTSSGDDLSINLGGGVTEPGTVVDLTSSQYSNGTLAIQMYSGTNSIFSISMYNGSRATRIDNITVSRYASTQVEFTPVAGTTVNTDSLSYEHNDADSNTDNPLLLPITGYMTSGGITINGNIEVNTVKKK